MFRPSSPCAIGNCFVVCKNDTEEIERRCKRCKVTKPIETFSVSKIRPELGRTHFCDPCKAWKQRFFQSEAGKADAKRTRGTKKCLVAKLRYQASSKGVKNRERFFASDTGKACRARDAATAKHRMRVDPVYRFQRNLRSALGSALKGAPARTLCARTDFANGQEIRDHFASLFTEGMTKENHGSYWVPDHIIACFHYDWSNDEDVRRCMSRTNMEPVRGIVNGQKGVKIPPDNELLAMGKAVWPLAWNGSLPSPCDRELMYKKARASKV